LDDAAMSASDSTRMSEATAEISSDPPGADIEVDGNFVGSTPSLVGIAPGDHTVRVSKSGYKPWERTLRSSTGNIKISAALAQAPVSPIASPSAPTKADSPITGQSSTSPTIEPKSTTPAGPPEEALIGVSFTGNPTVRHDGVEISGVQPEGASASVGIKPGDVIVAIDDHYLFTIDEVRAELLRHAPGTRLRLRYRHNQFISENQITLRADKAFDTIDSPK
jgi:hypothetical protein